MSVISVMQIIGTEKVVLSLLIRWMV